MQQSKWLVTASLCAFVVGCAEQAQQNDAAEPKPSERAPSEAQREMAGEPQHSERAAEETKETDPESVEKNNRDEQGETAQTEEEPSQKGKLARLLERGELEGTYSYTHTVGKMGRGSDGPEIKRREERQNCLVLENASDGIEFSLMTVTTNFHHCMVDGVAKRRDDRLVYEEELDDGSLCELSIEVDEDVVRLRDREGNCKSSYCGMRGSIDGEEFPRDERNDEVSKCTTAP